MSSGCGAVHAGRSCAAGGLLTVLRSMFCGLVVCVRRRARRYRTVRVVAGVVLLAGRRGRKLVLHPVGGRAHADGRHIGVVGQHLHTAWCPRAFRTSGSALAVVGAFGDERGQRLRGGHDAGMIGDMNGLPGMVDVHARDVRMGMQRSLNGFCAVDADEVGGKGIRDHVVVVLGVVILVCGCHSRRSWAGRARGRTTRPPTAATGQTGRSARR